MVLSYSELSLKESFLFLVYLFLFLDYCLFSKIYVEISIDGTSFSCELSVCCRKTDSIIHLLWKIEWSVAINPIISYLQGASSSMALSHTSKKATATLVPPSNQYSKLIWLSPWLLDKKESAAGTVLTPVHSNVSPVSLFDDPGIVLFSPQPSPLSPTSAKAACAASNIEKVHKKIAAKSVVITS